MSQVLVSADAPKLARPVRPRLDAVDWLRGFVMVVMALDHVRDFFGDVSFDAIDPHQTTVRHFFTRWITHFCADVYFSPWRWHLPDETRGRTKPQLSWFLLTRGAWLLLLELTYIRFFWTKFDLNYTFIPLGVFWSISWCMLLMSLIVFLPDWLITVLGLAMIVGHNALDGFGAAQLGDWGGIWTFVHDQGIDQGVVKIGWIKFATAYKLVPWVGVTMAGYGFGRVLLWDRESRQRFIVGLGLAMIAAFVVLRGINVYGDRTPRFTSPDSETVARIEKDRADRIAHPVPPTINPLLSPATFAALSFLNCEKYPPSLDYLLMTLGPASAPGRRRPTDRRDRPGGRDFRSGAAVLLPVAHRLDRAGCGGVLPYRLHDGIMRPGQHGSSSRRLGPAMGGLPDLDNAAGRSVFPVPVLCGGQGSVAESAVELSVSWPGADVIANSQHLGGLGR